MSPKEIRRIRKKLKHTQARASEIFGGGVNAFSKYELGKTVHPKALDVLLRILDKYPQYLREII